MIEKNISTEHPDEHWQFIECNDSVVLDLGCGRWEAVERRDPNWPTTPEYFIQRGARHVYAVDSDRNEIDWFVKNMTAQTNMTFIKKTISSAEEVSELYSTYQPSVVKCDIEHAELNLLNLSDDDFCKISMYAIETHSADLHRSFIEKFNTLGYEITAVLTLTHAPVKVIFAKRD